ncbi:hypothetical protein BSM4216_0992 [Bacillus smithii]|nr:hypothetical protein BSM4216_0992 [Bacillus smithii]
MSWLQNRRLPIHIFVCRLGETEFLYKVLKNIWEPFLNEWLPMSFLLHSLPSG